MKLTKKNLPAIEAEFARKGVADAIFFDDEMKRFGLRLRTSGRRSWIVQYEKFGRSRRVTFGNASVLTPEQARHLAKQALGKVDNGANVASDRVEEKIKAKRLFKSVVEQYLQVRKSEVRATTFTGNQPLSAQDLQAPASHAFEYDPARRCRQHPARQSQ